MKSIFNPFKRPTREVSASLKGLLPEQHLVVIGDIHGCADLLRSAFDRVDATFNAEDPNDGQVPHLVFVGDYIDRGEKSAEVLSLLFGIQRELPDKVTCLMGNHEKMMLDFIDDPSGRGRNWLRNGGLQTLSSYQIGGIREQSNVQELTEASQALEDTLPTGMLQWLRDLPLEFRSGNVCVVHAGMDPHLAPEEQSSRVLLWGHHDFMKIPRNDGLWVVHGHTIVEEPQIRPSRISIDTGAFHSGRLTVARIKPGACEFL